jgi:hypothetical protein
MMLVCIRKRTLHTNIIELANVVVYTRTDKANPEHEEYIEKKEMNPIASHSSSIEHYERPFQPSNEIIGESNRLT